MTLDKTDQQIITELSKNSRISMKELGEKVHLSGVAARARVDKLEDSGLIEGYTIKLGDRMLENNIHAMINVIMKSNFHKHYTDFIDKQTNHVIHNYRITGNSCYLLECRFSTQEQIDDFLERLTQYANYHMNIIIKDTITEQTV